MVIDRHDMPRPYRVERVEQVVCNRMPLSAHAIRTFARSESVEYTKIPPSTHERGDWRLLERYRASSRSRRLMPYAAIHTCVLCFIRRTCRPFGALRNCGRVYSRTRARGSCNSATRLPRSSVIHMRLAGIACKSYGSLFACGSIHSVECCRLCIASFEILGRTVKWNIGSPTW